LQSLEKKTPLKKRITGTLTEHLQINYGFLYNQRRGSKVA
jgi:hypothetical protein